MLNNDLIFKLRDVINQTEIFIQDEVESKKFNLICSVMDQFDNSVDYFNHRVKELNSSDAIILFLVHCCIIKDGINYVMKIMGKDVSQTDFFLKYAIADPINLDSNKYNGDDVFFEYIRSLFFAHPFLTSSSIPNSLKKEIQYSPYILNDRFNVYPDSKDAIGVMVYSNKREMFHINIKIKDLKKYIVSKYKLLIDIAQAFQEIIDNKVKEWSKRKVNRNLNPEKTLLDVIDILSERYLDCYDIKELLTYLTCPTSDSSNIDIINEYRKEIVNSIPAICDCVDSMDYEGLADITRFLLNPKLGKKYPLLHYHLEKIFGYLNDEGYGNSNFGLIQADAFSKEFAKDWVTIHPYLMSFDEIKLLTTIACFYEYKKDHK